MFTQKLIPSPYNINQTFIKIPLHTIIFYNGALAGLINIIVAALSNACGLQLIKELNITIMSYPSIESVPAMHRYPITAQQLDKYRK